MSGCGGSQKGDTVSDITDEEQQAQQKVEMYENVIDIHNEVMPKMDDLYRYRQLAIERLDSLGEGADEEMFLRGMIQNLEHAEEGMMQWMRQFEKPADTIAFELVIEYYQSEMDKVTVVKDSIVNGINRASIYLE